MHAQQSLEEDILAAFWEANQNLTVLDVKENLKHKNIFIPFVVLKRHIEFLEKAGFLKTHSGFGWGKVYKILWTQQQFENQPSEFLTVACLKTKGVTVVKRIVLNIVQHITCLHTQLIKGEDE